jgi:hypothetical protein
MVEDDEAAVVALVEDLEEDGERDVEGGVEGDVEGTVKCAVEAVGVEVPLRRPPVARLLLLPVALTTGNLLL